MRAPVSIACGLSLIASAAVALPAKYYQENVIKTCSGGLTCQAIFPAIPANRILKVESVSCRLYISSRSSTLQDMRLTSDKGDGSFYLRLDPISNPSGRSFAVSFSGPVYLSQGASPRVTTWASNTGTVNFDCNVSGELVKAPVETAGAEED